MHREASRAVRRQLRHSAGGGSSCIRRGVRSRDALSASRGEEPSINTRTDALGRVPESLHAGTCPAWHRPLCRLTSLELLGEPDEKPFGPANVAEPIRLLILHHVTNQLRAMPLNSGERLIDIINSEHKA